jgi:predicted dithiol-disulfide oxidoreductase (DUF899 family)
MNTFESPRIVSHEEWLAARLRLLAREREQTHRQDELAAERRRLPWVRIEKPYTFEGADGPVTLSELFAGRSQLFVYHFMLGPGWEEGCKSCSFVADHAEAARWHFEHHDVKFAVVSRAPYGEIAPFKRRMGWGFDWVSSFGNDFNFDFHVSFTPEQVAGERGTYNFQEIVPPIEELPGASVFAKNGTGEIFHTYSTYTRGLDILLGAHNFLDLTPKGRNETETMDWVRHHDRYEAVPQENAEACCHS